MVDSPFNEYSKNIFILGGPNFGERLPENVRKMGNDREGHLLLCKSGVVNFEREYQSLPQRWFLSTE